MTRRSAGPGSADSFASARQLALVARPVFDQLRFWLPALPAKRSPLVDRMERVDDHDRARERQASDRRAPAEALDQDRFLPAFQSSLSDPARDSGDFRFGHVSIIPAAGAGIIAAPGDGITDRLWKSTVSRAGASALAS